MYCNQCGNKLKDNAKFCTNCGHSINNITSEDKKSINKDNVDNSKQKLARKNFISGLFVIIIVIALIVGVTMLPEDNYENDKNMKTANQIPDCQVIAAKYINDKENELLVDWQGDYYKENIKNVTVDYSPKLNDCLIMYTSCTQDNICFINIDDLSNKYDCDLGGDDPIAEEANRYFQYLITGEASSGLGDYYIEKLKSECNIVF